MSDRVCIAQFGAPHGVRGELRLRSFTQNAADVTSYGPLETEDGARRFTIETMRPAKDHFVVRIAGIADRDAAERLTNVKLYVDRARLPQVDDDEFYFSDLIGMAAVGTDGAPVGTVTAVHNFGAGDLIEIAPGGVAEPMLLPFTAAAVPSISVAERRMVVVPPAEVESEQAAEQGPTNEPV